MTYREQEITKLESSQRLTSEQERREAIKGRRILITGGTGWLGSHLAREILPFEPQEIRLFDRIVDKPHRLETNLKEEWSALKIIPGDVSERADLTRAIRGVDIVFHLAAMKHVTLAQKDPYEAVKSNIIGSYNVVDLAIKEESDKVVGVSSDKASSPKNVYGITKALTEALFCNPYSPLREIESAIEKIPLTSEGARSSLDLVRRNLREHRLTSSASPLKPEKAETKLSVIRYGNFWGSTGSVVPLWIEKAKKGEPIKVTNPEMTRFVIMYSEIIDLLFYALTRSLGREVIIPRSPAFILGDLAKVVAEKYNVGIEVIGARPGEKIHEDLLSEYERPFARTAEDGRLLILTPRKKQEENPSAYSSREAPKLTKEQLANLLEEMERQP